MSSAIHRTLRGPDLTEASGRGVVPLGKAQGHSDYQKTDWFEGLAVVLQDNGGTFRCVIVSGTSNLAGGSPMSELLELIRSSYRSLKPTSAFLYVNS